jgi:hypothetical protein
MGNLTEILKEIGLFLGTEEISFDDEGFCMMQLQDQFAFVIRVDQKLQRIVIAAEIAKPTTLSKELLIKALSFNFNRMGFSGAWMAIDAETKALFLADEFLLAAMEITDIRKRLGSFFQHYLTCQGFYNDEALVALLEKEKKQHDLPMEIDQLA